MLLPNLWSFAQEESVFQHLQFTFSPYFTGALQAVALPAVALLLYPKVGVSV